MDSAYIMTTMTLKYGDTVIYFNLLCLSLTLHAQNLYSKFTRQFICTSLYILPHQKTPPKEVFVLIHLNLESIK